ncbi:MAG TPA: hypothetical protein VJ047_15075 [Pseudomonas sp.]|nr:hypothetical protein [Pseudomonas sp.]
MPAASQQSQPAQTRLRSNHRIASSALATASCRATVAASQLHKSA